jgi:beta-lactamase class A
MPFRLPLIVICAFSQIFISPAQHTDALQRADQRVKAKVTGFRGKVSVYAKNLSTGLSYGILPDEPVRTASTIKLAIMVECFSEAAQRKLKWSEPIMVVEDEKVSGSGVVQELSSGDELPIRDLMHLMIVVSDNTATNLILNRIRGNAVNARMRSLDFGRLASCERYSETEAV